MADLVARTPLEGLVPLQVGDMVLREAAPAQMTLLGPRKGGGDALGRALQAAHGLELPEPGQIHVAQSGKARILWFGRDSYLLEGAKPDDSLAKHAALIEQSDAWARAELLGTGAVDVLARLTPLDLRDSAFPPGATARSELRHMMASITRLERDRWLLMVFRSMAGTLVHDLKRAMQAVQARGR